MEKNKILIVDDESEIRRIIATFFSQRGYEVVSVDSGVLGLNLLTKDKFDCLISDIRMPFMDGIEFTRRARQLNPDLAIILLTGYGSLASAEEAIITGVQGYLEKPVELEKLKAAVDDSVQKFASRKSDANRYKQLEQQLEIDRQKLDAMRLDLTTLISHELRTPVAVIAESFSLLKDIIASPSEGKQGKFSEEDKERLFEFLEHGHRRLVALIEDISYFMNLKNRLTPLQTSEIELNGFLDASFSAFEHLISGSNASLKKELSKDKYLVSIDKEKFLDLLARIINNCMRHNPQAVDITLKSSFEMKSGSGKKEDGFAKIEIIDNGRGIEKELIDMLFHPFTVANMNQHTNGIGLGFAISREIVELHSGRISVANRGQKGVIVTIEVPALCLPS